MSIKISSESFLNRRLKNFLKRRLMLLENLNNSNIKTNGELRFLEDFIQNFRGKSCVIFDVGANVGDYTQLIVEECRKYKVDFSLHVFEPVPGPFEELKSHFGNEKNITLNMRGASSSSGKSVIYTNKESTSLEGPGSLKQLLKSSG